MPSGSASTQGECDAPASQASESAAKSAYLNHPSAPRLSATPAHSQPRRPSRAHSRAQPQVPAAMPASTGTKCQFHSP